MANNDLTRVKVRLLMVFCVKYFKHNFLSVFRELLLLNQLYMETLPNILAKNDMKMVILTNGVYM